MKKLMPFVATVLAASGLLVQKIPHMRLVAQLASGSINGDPVTVTDFVPVRFQEETITYRCRELVFDVPRRAAVMPVETWTDECWAYWVWLDGMTCHLWAPRHENPNAENWRDTRSCAGAAGDEEIDRQAAICAASWRDFSFWTGAADVEALHARLEIRPAFCLSGEHVEVVRGASLCGLLRCSVCEDRPRMVLDYFSPDNRLQGIAILRAEAGADPTMYAGRALVSTFRLEPDSCSPAPW